MMQYGTAEVQALLAKPAKIAAIYTANDEVFCANNTTAIVLLPNHNAIVVRIDAITGKEIGYHIIASSAITMVEMEVERAE